MANKILKEIDVKLIDPNPENPRMIFRQQDLDNLLQSISKIGVQVPISVYKNKNRFVLIDGERRLRVCKKLNISKIPAIIQEKPSPLDNLLMMFNIHALREQWDHMTIALKLPKVKSLYHKNYGKYPNETQLSEETGLPRSIIRRCTLLINLPDRFQDQILVELNKPKGKQKLTEDFFLEMEGALKTVQKNYPDYIKKLDDVRDTLIDKYKNNVIKSVTDFRKLSKIATAPQHVEFSRKMATKALDKVFTRNEFSIDDIFVETVGNLYQERKFILNAENFIHYVSNLNESERRDDEIRSLLKKIRKEIDKILGG